MKSPNTVQVNITNNFYGTNIHADEKTAQALVEEHIQDALHVCLKWLSKFRVLHITFCIYFQMYGMGKLFPGTKVNVENELSKEKVGHIVRNQICLTN